MIARITDPQEVNAIANDEGVRRLMFLGMPYPQYDLDFTEALANSKAVALTNNEGFCAIFNWTSPGTYECHIMAKKDARGAAMMKDSREMLQYMKEHGAQFVWGQPSIYNRGAICFIRRMGLKSRGVRDDPMLGEVEDFVTEGL